MSANVKKVSDYKKQVLNTNAKLKSTHKTLGGCLKNMHHFGVDMGLSASQKSTVKLLRGNHELYKEFQKVCRKSKSGNYSPFYVLQAMYKASKPITVTTTTEVTTAEVATAETTTKKVVKKAVAKKKLVVA